MVIEATQFRKSLAISLFLFFSSSSSIHSPPLFPIGICMLNVFHLFRVKLPISLAHHQHLPTPNTLFKMRFFLHFFFFSFDFCSSPLQLRRLNSIPLSQAKFFNLKLFFRVFFLWGWHSQTSDTFKQTSRISRSDESFEI